MTTTATIPPHVLAKVPAAEYIGATVPALEKYMARGWIRRVRHGAGGFKVAFTVPDLEDLVERLKARDEGEEAAAAPSIS